MHTAHSVALIEATDSLLIQSLDALKVRSIHRRPERKTHARIPLTLDRVSSVRNFGCGVCTKSGGAARLAIAGTEAQSLLDDTDEANLRLSLGSLHADTRLKTATPRVDHLELLYGHGILRAR